MHYVCQCGWKSIEATCDSQCHVCKEATNIAACPVNQFVMHDREHLRKGEDVTITKLAA
jgi:hypothetical protein